jgi:DNA-directed RNA polymerase sigma subunit (sigma70/sigma32)
MKKHPKSPKTVLAFLGANKLPIPDDHRLAELRLLARQHLQDLEGSWRDRNLITDYYGLGEDGRTFQLNEVMRKYSISSGTVYSIQRKVFAKLQATHEEA